MLAIENNSPTKHENMSNVIAQYRKQDKRLYRKFRDEFILQIVAQLETNASRSTSNASIKLEQISDVKTAKTIFNVLIKLDLPACGS